MGQASGEKMQAHSGISVLEGATRDVVSRGIYAEMRKNNSSPKGGVYISMAHLGPDMVAKKFKGMAIGCRRNELKPCAKNSKPYPENSVKPCAPAGWK